MKPPALVSVGLLVLQAAPRGARACDPASYERAAISERAHRLGAAIVVRTRLLACASGDDTALRNELALASDHAAIGDFARAAELIERAAEHGPAAGLVGVMPRAVEYRLALGDLTRAQADARWLLGAAGEAAIDPAFAVGVALEAGGRWTEASLWYDALARRFPARAQWAVQAGALVGLGRAYAALGDLGSAVQSWEAANARWPVARAALGIAEPCANEPEPSPEPTRRSRRGRARGSTSGRVSGVVSPFGGMTEPGVDNCAVSGHFRSDADADSPLRFLAEARFRLARRAAEPCVHPIRYGPVPTSRVDFDRWVESDLIPTLQRRQACVDDTTRRMVDVANLFVPQWEIAAVAVVAHVYATFAWSMGRSPVPPDLRPSNPARFVAPEVDHVIP